MEARAPAGQGEMPGPPRAAGTVGQFEGGHLEHLRQSEECLDQGAAAQAAAVVVSPGAANDLIQAVVQANQQIGAHPGQIHLQLGAHHHRKRIQHLQGEITPQQAHAVEALGDRQQNDRAAALLDGPELGRHPPNAPGHHRRLGAGAETEGQIGFQLQIAGHGGEAIGLVAFGQCAGAGGGAEIERQIGLVQRLHPHRLATQGAHQGDQVVPRHRIAAEDLPGGGLPIGSGAGEQILDRPLAAVGQLGEGKTQLLEDRDARIVAIEITPLIAAEPPQQLQRLSPQPGIAQGGVGVGVEGYGGCKHVVNPQLGQNSGYGTTFELEDNNKE